MHIQSIQTIDDVQRSAQHPHSHSAEQDAAEAAAVTPGGRRAVPLRIDAQRNLEHVLRAAREVFGELGYGAPMEDVARRARVGVGTVYRRFPSKEVLVRRIAQEEMARLTEQARSALGEEERSWSALSRFLRTSVASGAGRLLPPRILQVGTRPEVPGVSAAPQASGAPEELRTESVAGPRLPQQRYAGDAAADGGGADGSGADGVAGDGGALELHLVEPQPGHHRSHMADKGAAALLNVVGQLVDRAHDAGELRPDVTVADVLLVIATAAPSLPDAAQQAEASTRLLDILLEGLRSRPKV